MLRGIHYFSGAHNNATTLSFVMPKFHVLQNVECREAFSLAVAYIVRLELVSDGGKKNISGVSLSGQKHHHIPPKETNC